MSYYEQEEDLKKKNISTRKLILFHSGCNAAFDFIDKFNLYNIVCIYKARYNATTSNTY